jgi:glycosyltransferase involved in cell wall biosynthesis
LDSGTWSLEFQAVNDMNTNTRTPIDILYVITKSNWGGAQRYVYDIAVAAKEQFSVAVALGGSGTLVERLEAADIPVHAIASFQRDISFGKELGTFVELFRIFRKLRPNIVHLNSSKAGGIGALAAQLAGVPKVIYTSHGLPFEEDRPSWQKALITVATWITFILCDIVIAITHANLKKVARMPLMGYRPRLIRLGIPESNRLSRAEARKQLQEICGIPKDLTKALWMGTIAEYHPNKGLLHLIQGLELLRKKHPNIVCVLIGGGELDKKLSAEIDLRGLSKNVFLAGFLPDAASYLSAFDIFTLTSIKEGMPYVLLEAGNASLPIVGSALPGIAEVVTDMSSGILVRPKAPREIEGALELLIEDAPRRKEYGEALKTRIESDFSEKEMLEKTLALYAHLVVQGVRQDRREKLV